MGFSKLSDLLTGRFRFTQPASPHEGQGGGGHGYDPHQPRVPAGQHEGGRWTRFGIFASGTRHAAEAASETPRATPVGLTSTDNVGRAKPALAGPQFARDTTNYVIPGMRATLPRIQPNNAWTVLHEQSEHYNGPDQQVILDIRSKEFVRDDSAPLGIVELQVLTREQLARRCPRFEHVQRFLDEEYARLRAKHPEWGPRRLGTGIHHEVKKRIEEENDEDFKAEISYQNGKEDEWRNQNYAKPGSLRVDSRSFPKVDNDGEELADEDAAALVRLSKKSACLFEMITSETRVKRARYESVANVTARAFKEKGIDHLIVTEVRPTQLYKRLKK